MKMNARQPRAEYRQMARIAEYTAQVARRLADDESMEPQEVRTHLRKLKNSVGSGQAQFDAIMRCICAEEGAERPARREILSVGATRAAIADALVERSKGEDPDWIGSALCDLNTCETERDFRLWAEENRFDGMEELLWYREEDGKDD